MANRSATTAGRFGEKLRHLLRRGSGIPAMLGTAAASAVMANAAIAGGISPFGAAFCAALPAPYTYMAALGAVLGYIFSAALLTNMKYLAAVVMVCAIRWLLSSGCKTALLKPVNISEPLGAALCGFAAMGTACAAILFTGGRTMYDGLLGLSETLLCCGAAYFFSRAAVSLRAGWASAAKIDQSCVVISFAIVIMGLSGVTVAGLSLGRILAALAVLLAARYRGEGAGAVLGVTAGIALSLAGGEASYVLAAYAAGGLVAGMFGELGRLASASAFVVINAVAAMLAHGSTDVYSAVFEVFAASAAFMVAPQSLISRLRPIRGETVLADSDTQHILQERLEDVAQALSEIGETTRKVSEGLGKLGSPGPEEISDRVAERCCKFCGLKTVCWQFQYSDTQNAMNDALSVLRRTGSINRELAPRYFHRTCCRFDDLLAELNTQFQSYMSHVSVSRKVSQVRAVVTDQFSGMSGMINEIARELCDIRQADAAKARRVREYFEKEGLTLGRCRVVSDHSERLSAEITIPNFQLARLNQTKSALDLCALLEAEFDLPEVIRREQYACVRYIEKAVFKADIGVFQIACGRNKLCGDSYAFIRNKGGRAHFIVSDGMGCGGGAAVDSSLASELLSRLLEVGVGHDAALRMVNSALLVKSGEESLATIDICTVDLYTGRAGFFKAGAAPTFLIKNGKTGIVESASLPAGILRAVSFDHSSLGLHDHDTVVMVSDGVVSSGSAWVRSELELLRDLGPQELCERLAATAKDRRGDGHDDDITVLAFSLAK